MIPNKKYHNSSFSFRVYEKQGQVEGNNNQKTKQLD